MTIKELRKLLARLSTSNDEMKFVIWLPGSRIDITATRYIVDHKNGEVMLEGELRAGSALS